MLDDTFLLRTSEQVYVSPFVSAKLSIIHHIPSSLLLFPTTLAQVG